MSPAPSPSCLVVGGGVAGLAVARGIARGGAQVTVLERGRSCGQEASAAAAGMLAEGAEAPRSGPFLELCRQSRRLWPTFAEELLAESQVDCELQRSGLVRVTTDQDVASDLERQAELQRAEGVEVSQLLDLEQLRQLVGGLGDSVRAGLHYPNDWHVHSHRVVEALLGTDRRLGVKVETEVEAKGVDPGGSRPRVRMQDGEVREADFVVVCAGSWSGGLLGEGGPGPELEPVRGQIVALDPGRPLLPRIVFGDGGYLLQKRGGLVLIGTTEERAGFASWPTLQGVLGVAAAGLELVPELAQARFAYVWAGLRPHFADGLPLLGRLEPGGRVLLATGHFRNGVLLAPVTGELIARAVLEGEDPPELAAFSPRRGR